jgi:LAS superfamily LD-carboxypeptidase LdcB
VPSLDDLDPRIAPYAHYLVDYIAARVPVRITSVYRSYTEQLELYRNRATNPYPVAPPGHSMHNYRRAWDMVADPEVLDWAGRTWESWGGKWGGRIGDPIHFEA